MERKALGKSETVCLVMHQKLVTWHKIVFFQGVHTMYTEMSLGEIRKEDKRPYLFRSLGQVQLMLPSFVWVQFAGMVINGCTLRCGRVTQHGRWRQVMCPKTDEEMKWQISLSADRKSVV